MTRSRLKLKLGGSRWPIQGEIKEVLQLVNKVTEGRPHVVDMIKNDEVTLIINTTEGRQSIADSYSIRRNALQHKIYCTTTIAAGEAICEALKFGPEKTVRRLQDLHAGLKA